MSGCVRVGQLDNAAWAGRKSASNRYPERKAKRLAKCLAKCLYGRSLTLHAEACHLGNVAFDM